MRHLTGTKHGDSANELLVFYEDKVRELEECGQYFMAAVALGFALETVLLTYLLVEFSDDNGGELRVPDSVGMAELIDAANYIDVLDAPIAPLGPAEESQKLPKYIAKEVIDKIRLFRNLIHPARALRKAYDPKTFNWEQLEEFKEIYQSVTYSLLYFL